MRRRRDRDLEALERTLKALADPTRLRIVGLVTTGELCVCRIYESLGLPQAKVSRHLAYLRRAGLVETRKTGKWVHYRIVTPAAPIVETVLRSVGRSLERTVTVQDDRQRLRGATAGCGPTHVVLFACVHNAGRSQIAAAFFNALADPSRARAISAGTRPASAVQPEVATVMNEAGIDLSAARPRRLTDALAARANVLITVGCDQACPVVPGVERDDWALPDPKGRSLPEVRAIRDAIRARVEAFVARRGWRA